MLIWPKDSLIIYRIWYVYLAFLNLLKYAAEQLQNLINQLLFHHLYDGKYISDKRNQHLFVSYLLLNHAEW